MASLRLDNAILRAEAILSQPGLSERVMHDYTAAQQLMSTAAVLGASSHASYFASIDNHISSVLTASHAAQQAQDEVANLSDLLDAATVLTCSVHPVDSNADINDVALEAGELRRLWTGLAAAAERRKTRENEAACEVAGAGAAAAAAAAAGASLALTETEFHDALEKRAAQLVERQNQLSELVRSSNALPAAVVEVLSILGDEAGAAAAAAAGGAAAAATHCELLANTPVSTPGALLETASAALGAVGSAIGGVTRQTAGVVPPAVVSAAADSIIAESTPYLIKIIDNMLFMLPTPPTRGVDASSSDDPSTTPTSAASSVAAAAATALDAALQPAAAFLELFGRFWLMCEKTISRVPGLGAGGAWAQFTQARPIPPATTPAEIGQLKKTLGRFAEHYSDAEQRYITLASDSIIKTATTAARAGEESTQALCADTIFVAQRVVSRAVRTVEAGVGSGAAEKVVELAAAALQRVATFCVRILPAPLSARAVAAAAAAGSLPAPPSASSLTAFESLQSVYTALTDIQTYLGESLLGSTLTPFIETVGSLVAGAPDGLRARTRAIIAATTSSVPKNSSEHRMMAYLSRLEVQMPEMLSQHLEAIANTLGTSSASQAAVQASAAVVDGAVEGLTKFVTSLTVDREAGRKIDALIRSIVAAMAETSKKTLRSPFSRLLTTTALLAAAPEDIAMLAAGAGWNENETSKVIKQRLDL